MTTPLPQQLREQLEGLVEDVGLATLREASRRLAAAYAQGRAPAALDRPAALAYAAMRLPGTLSALTHVLGQVSTALAPSEPLSLLDLCAGPGTAVLACAMAGIRLKEAVCVDREPAMIELGRQLTQMFGAQGASVHWECANATTYLENNARRFELVVVGYALGELSPSERQALVELAWPGVACGFVLVEPGTPAGSSRLLEVRERLRNRGARLLAPCSHEGRCPLGEYHGHAPQGREAAGVWCHFSQRLARSRLSRLIDGGEAAYEDEKFAYLVASPIAAPKPPAGRLIGHPRLTQAGMLLAVCGQDGKFKRLLVPKRQKHAYRLARKLRWGDRVAEEILAGAQPCSE